jgi:hypothetical protein
LDPADIREWQAAEGLLRNILPFARLTDTGWFQGSVRFGL